MLRVACVEIFAVEAIGGRVTSSAESLLQPEVRLDAIRRRDDRDGDPTVNRCHQAVVAGMG